MTDSNNSLPKLLSKCDNELGIGDSKFYHTNLKYDTIINNSTLTGRLKNILSADLYNFIRVNLNNELNNAGILTYHYVRKK